MTHPSFSGENNRALSILGLYAIETSISLHCLERNIEMSPKELSRKVKEISEVGTCAIDGTRLGLDKIVRVSTKTNSTVPSVVCGAFRAVFGAIGVDAGNADDAGEVFWNVNHHGCGGGGASAM
ncbi:hypothetical protein IFM89_032142 [Coptis chinensis]|uniref:RNase III domain-containing protein n=1 Tax=Coptis chinensis TaxID=261450 RepID=A0A835J379_9MAGN|nr:hypothetical protein IFM89_032142 [Coptis chinensis]